jgi:multiple sugar transport system substrate-binding protein
MASSIVCLVWATTFVLPAACERRQEGDVSRKAVRLRAWGHAGREAERKTIEAQVQAFNEKTDDVRVELTLLPEGEYNAQVQAAALADELPDVLEFDGPFVYNYVWQGHLIPLDPYISQELRDNLLPSIIAQGTYRKRLWSLGQYDSGLALFGRKSKLQHVDARIPSEPDGAWTVDEFEEILGRLAREDEDGHVLDLKLNYMGEWYTYGFSPALWSAGAGLIDRGDYQSTKGVLNSADAVDAMTRIQAWIESKGYVDPNVDDYAFVGGRVALSWVGHWEYARYSEAFGDDLVVIPLPDFGEGSKTGQGSWNWGITRSCTDPAAAMRFIEYLLGDNRVLEMTRANHAVPATRSAVSKSELHGEGGALHLYVIQLSQGYAVPRPRTPAYPVITSVFQQAFGDIRHGADVSTVLERAAAEIDRDICDNQGYPPQTEEQP